MWEWLETLWDPQERPPRSKRLFLRKITLSGPVLAWLNEPNRSRAAKEAFAELLLKLDVEPYGEGTCPLLGPGIPAGLRWAPFEGHTAIYSWDPLKGHIKIIKCA